MVKRYGPGETVEGLPLTTLGGLRGLASFTPQWDSTGKAPGQYYVEVTAQDASGTVLDRRTERLTLGAPEGRVTGLTATPQTFRAGDGVTLSMMFNNTGSLGLTGTAVLCVQTESGVIVQEFQHGLRRLLLPPRSAEGESPRPGAPGRCRHCPRDRRWCMRSLGRGGGPVLKVAVATLRSAWAILPSHRVCTLRAHARRSASYPRCIRPARWVQWRRAKRIACVVAHARLAVRRRRELAYACRVLPVSIYFG